MDNFKIISRDIIKAEEIMLAKKLKTRGADFKNIKDAANVESLEKPVVSFEKPKEKEITREEEIFRKMEAKKEEVEPEIDYAYSARQEEEIDYGKIERIKNELGNSYKGHNPKEEKPKEELKQEKKVETKITRELYEEEFNKVNYSDRIRAYKNNIWDGYKQILNKIDTKTKEISSITSEYVKETEIGSKLQETMKDIKDVLNGINSWNLDVFSKRKDDRTKSLVDHIGSYFEEDRQLLNQIFQEIKNSDGKKETLGKAEKRAREELSSLEKQLNEYMIKTYPKLKEANLKDEKLKESDTAITEFTGIAEDKVDEPIPVIKSMEQPVRNPVSDIKNLRELRTNDINNYNRFEELETDIPEYRIGRA